MNIELKNRIAELENQMAKLIERESEIRTALLDLSRGAILITKRSEQAEEIFRLVLKENYEYKWELNPSTRDKIESYLNY